MFTIALMTAFYFLPTIVAVHRGHRLGGVLTLNLLFGWTGIGWAALMIWALLSAPRFYAYAVPFPVDCHSPRYAAAPRF